MLIVIHYTLSNKIILKAFLCVLIVPVFVLQVFILCNKIYIFLLIKTDFLIIKYRLYIYIYI